jgi:hypothetical protein
MNEMVKSKDWLKIMFVQKPINKTSPSHGHAVSVHLTPWSRGLQKLMVAHQVKKFSASY